MKLKIIADVHESNVIIDYLKEMNVIVEIKRLDVADYIISERVGIERKSSEDFLNSLINNRLFEQVNRLKEAFEKPILIIEGDIFSFNFNPNAIVSCLIAMILDYDLRIFFTRNKKETAIFIYHIARREQLELKSKPKIRHKPKLLTLREKQMFLVMGLPNIGEKLAFLLLKKFKTPRRIFMASRKQLESIIGEKRAKEIVKVLDTEFKTKQETLNRYLSKNPSEKEF